MPLKPVGRLVLNRNPDNFFAETEQVAFCAGHLVPGIDFTNDPLLPGRIHSYVDTQISRLGGPNFHEIPINSPVAPLHNNQRDGMHRQAINRGRVSYEPNSLAGGCPFQQGAARGFTSFPDETPEAKVRGKPEKFADHFTQATLFWRSQSPVEQAHIVRGFRFELTKVQTPAIRERVLSQLAAVDAGLAGRVAAGLGMEVPPPMPAPVRPGRTRGEGVAEAVPAGAPGRRPHRHPQDRHPGRAGRGRGGGDGGPPRARRRRGGAAAGGGQAGLGGELRRASRWRRTAPWRPCRPAPSTRWWYLAARRRRRR